MLIWSTTAGCAYTNSRGMNAFSWLTVGILILLSCALVFAALF